MFCAAFAFVALARIRSACALSCAACFSALLALASSATFVALALREIGGPTDVVDVELRTVGIEVEDPVDRRLDDGHVVRDDHEPALVVAQELAQPTDRVGIEVVGGLVEQQCLGPAEQDARQLDASSLTTRQGPEGLLEDTFREADTCRDGRRLRLGGVAAPCSELLLQLGVPAHRLITGVVVGAGHPALGLPDEPDDLVETPGTKDPVPCQHAKIAGTWVLRQVAHVAGPGHAAGRGECLAGENPHERGLAGAVTTYEPDAVTR